MKETIYYKTLNLKNLLVFVIPTMLMTVIQSLYSMIDGGSSCQRTWNAESRA